MRMTYKGRGFPDPEEKCRIVSEICVEIEANERDIKTLIENEKGKWKKKKRVTCGYGRSRSGKRNCQGRVERQDVCVINSVSHTSIIHIHIHI